MERSNSSSPKSGQKNSQSITHNNSTRKPSPAEAALQAVLKRDDSRREVNRKQSVKQRARRSGSPARSITSIESTLTEESTPPVSNRIEFKNPPPRIHRDIHPPPSLPLPEGLSKEMYQRRKRFRTRGGRQRVNLIKPEYLPFLEDDKSDVDNASVRSRNSVSSMASWVAASISSRTQSLIHATTSPIVSAVRNSLPNFPVDGVIIAVENAIQHRATQMMMKPFTREVQKDDSDDDDDDEEVYLNEDGTPFNFEK